MMKTKTRGTLTAALAVAAATAVLTACGGRSFSVEGEITGAQDSVLYLENVGLTELTVVDSARLGQDGRFAFSGDAASAPEFYRLRIADQIINLSIDSTETVTVRAQYPQMATGYTVEGSANCERIKELALKQIALQQQVVALERNIDLGRTQRLDSLQRLLTAYKDEVKNEYIFKAPYKSYAYFALFQTLGPWLIFDPKANRDDIKVFAAVATSWDTYYPGSERGRNLHNIAIEGMKTTRIVDAQNQTVEVDASKVESAGLIDIPLRDNKGRERSLKELKGKVVLLDFHLFAMDDSPKRILMLRELYNKYHAQGLEVYQVSLDPDEHFWKQQTAALPWISVREPAGISSPTLTIYNIQGLPEFFLIDRGNNLVKRSQQMKDLEAEIKRLL